MTLDDVAAASDHFALFGLPRRFDLDENELQSRMLRLTRLTHPDFAGADEASQERAMELSAKVNDAHRVLSDSEARANYLLSLLGGPGKDQDKSLPDGFLEQMMRVREELADAQLEADAATLAAMEQQARAERERHLARLKALFAQDPAPLSEIRMELNAMRYIERMLEQIHPDQGAVI